MSVEEQNNKPENTSPASASTDASNETKASEEQATKESQIPEESSLSKEESSSKDAIDAYQQTADSSNESTTYSAKGTVESDSTQENGGVYVSPTTINSPFQAVKAIILKPNPVFAKLKDTGNWSWIPFLLVAFCSALPSWLYFSSVDMNWYTDLIVQLEYSDISPTEQANMKQMMMQEGMANYTAVITVISLVLVYAILALYLHKITQIDEDNVLSYGDWYGFMWWVSIPFAIFSLITALLIVVNGGPEIRPEMLSPFSLASILGLDIDSDWFGWAQGIGPDVFWSVYLMTVGISQWTKLSSRQCLIIASAPFAIIWGLWAISILT